MLNWCNRFNICCFLDNHNYHLSHHSIECLLAAGVLDSITGNAGDAFSQLKTFSTQHNDWLFGHFSYDLKNEIEQLHSSQPDNIGFPELFFFVPEVLIQLSDNLLTIGICGNRHEEIFKEITGHPPEHLSAGRVSDVHTRYTKAGYVSAVKKLQQHILRGDCYEINFCQEFYAENVVIDPLQLFITLSQASPNPFSAYYRLNDKYTACLSPERYLKKENERIISQPIKGTAQRNRLDPELDKRNAEQLRNSEKERAENIMVVDLVRNDLSKICEQGTVQVDELCGIYSFPQVHQMISTVSGILQPGLHWTDAIRATFPMGSMTGAPKKRVMELIEQYERSRRGLFSGSIGYVSPLQEFDFNVVIRSVFYNRTTRYLSFPTGSAITFSSDPELEYEECLLKAEVIKKALAETNTFH